MTEEQVKALKTLRENYRQTFGTEAGQKVMEDLRSRCFATSSTYESLDARGNYNPNVATDILVNEGQRRVLMSIENMMSMDIESLIIKLSEEK